MSQSEPALPLVQKALAYFAVVFGAGFLLGIIRVPLLVPRLGERSAELAEMPVMFAVIYFASRHLVRSSRSALSDKAWGGVGALALLTLLAAELLLAVALQDRTLGEYLASRDPVSGAVYLAMLLVYAAMPLVQNRLQKLST